MTESTQDHNATTLHTEDQAQVLQELSEQLGESGSAVLYLAAQMATVPLQEQLVSWVFEQSGQDLAAGEGLAACEKLHLAEQVEPGVWSVDCEVASHMVLSLKEPEQEYALGLRLAAVQFFNLSVDGHIPAPLIASDLEHIRFLTSQVTSEIECDLLIWLADFAYQNDDAATSAQSWQAIYNYLGETFGEEHENTLTAMNNLAENLRALGHFDDALALYKYQLDICNRVFGDDDLSTLTSMQNMAAVLRESGDLLAAKDVELKVLEQRKVSQGEDHPDTLITINNFASTLKGLGDLVQARVLQQEVLLKQKARHSIEAPEVTEAAWNLIQTFLAQDDYDAVQDVLFDDLFWLMNDNAVIQSQSQLKIKDMLMELLNQRA